MVSNSHTKPKGVLHLSPAHHISSTPITTRRPGQRCHDPNVPKSRRDDHPDSQSYLQPWQLFVGFAAFWRCIWYKGGGEKKPVFFCLVEENPFVVFFFFEVFVVLVVERCGLNAPNIFCWLQDFLRKWMEPEGYQKKVSFLVGGFNPYGVFVFRPFIFDISQHWKKMVRGEVAWSGLCWSADLQLLIYMWICWPYINSNIPMHIDSKWWKMWSTHCSQV